jgi:predicted component of type VI protein secretion system
MRDLRRYEGSSVAEPVEAPNPVRSRRAGPDLRAGVSPRLEVVAAMGHEPGTTFDVGEGATLGRSNGADIRVDDPFASSAHARIFSRGDFLYVEDMGSTNGTYLNGRQLRTAERLKMADVIRIGDSEYRYEE